ncbi:hypothetical protein D3C81_1974590 [compost metagenome]
MPLILPSRSSVKKPKVTTPEIPSAFFSSLQAQEIRKHSPPIAKNNRKATVFSWVKRPMSNSYLVPRNQLFPANPDSRVTANIMKREVTSTMPCVKATLRRVVGVASR